MNQSSSDRHITGAFSPLYPYDFTDPDGTIGTLQRPMELRWDWRSACRVFIPLDEAPFWSWFLDTRPDLAREASERHLAILEATKP